MAPIHCVLMRSPSILFRYDPSFVQVASSFLDTLIVFHRIYCSDEHGLPVPFKAVSSLDQSTSDY